MNHSLFALFWLLLYPCHPLAGHALYPLTWHHGRACCWDLQQACVRPYLHLGPDQDVYLVLLMGGPLMGCNHHSFWQLGEEQAWRASSLKSQGKALNRWMTDPAISSQCKVSVTHYIKKTLKNLTYKQFATFCNYVSINKPKFGKVNPNDCPSLTLMLFSSLISIYFFRFPTNIWK